MLKNWLKIAFLQYKKNWLSTFINLFGLTIGLTGFMLILMHWNDEESFEKWNPKKDNIYGFQAYYKSDNLYGSGTSYPIAATALEKIPEIEDVFLLNATGVSFKMMAQGKSIFQEDGMRTSDSFFNFFPFKLVSGSYKNPLKDKLSINISTEVAHKLFGKTNVAGESIVINNEKYVIQSVYELPKENSQIKPQFVFLAYESIQNDKTQWGNFNYAAFFLLKDGVDPKIVDQKITKEAIDLRAKLGAREGGISVDEYKRKYGPNSVELVSLSQLKLHAKASWFGDSDFKTIMILFTLSVLIVILSAINFINLKTAQAAQRAKEVGVRKAIGSSRGDLVLQFLLETFIICFFAFVFSLVLVELLLPSFNQFLNKELVLNNPSVIGYSFLMVVVVSFISGLIPALYLSNFKAIETLKGNFARSKHGAWLRNGILTLQLMISSFFIIGGLVVNAQVKYMMNKDLGFSGKQVMLIQFMENISKPWLKYERVKAELSKIPGVSEVSFSEATPANSNLSDSNVDYKDKSIQARHGSMDYNYLQFMGVKLKKGRWLDPNLTSDTINTLIVNEAFVKKFGFTDDQMLKTEIYPGFDNKKYKVVGIVKDFNLQGLKTSINPVVFFHYKETSWKRYNMYDVLVKMNPDDIEGTKSRIQDYWSTKVEPGYPFQSYFVDQKFQKTFEKYQKQQTLFTVLNVMVLIVALLGLFALSSLMIEQKLKTVVIRKTLGASDKNLIFGLTRQFLYITLIAVLISIPISYYLMNEWLKDFAFRIDMPWFPYVLSLILLLTLTFAVVCIKAYQATKVNLVKYLKYE